MLNTQDNRSSFYQDVYAFDKHQIRQMTREVVESYKNGAIDGSTFQWDIEFLLALFLERNIENKLSRTFYKLDKKLFKYDFLGLC